ncbi:MAG: S-layer protein [Candidatus Nanohaloarchaea archaeon]
MKRIKKLAKGATTVLLAGATLTGAAAAANLGDYPNQFIDEDGAVDANIVVGQSAKTVDVVGAIDIAGSLSQSATTEETVSTGNSGGEWTSSGTTLDTRNDNLYFLDSLDTVRQTLTQEQLPALEENTFRDDSGDETSIEYFLYPGSQQVTFGKPDDRSNEDPVLYVNNPSSPSSSSHLFQLQANFEDGINFTAGDVQDEDIQLFGQTFTVSTDTTGSELVLLGSQETTSIDSGSSKTVTINGNEHTIEVVAVTDSDTAAFRVDGELMEKDEEQTFTIDGTEVRVDDVIQTNADSSQGTVQFAIGSDEMVLRNGQQIEDEDGNDVDGTYVEFQGTDSADSGSGVVNELQGINIYVGSNNDDKEYVMAGESFSHPLFPDFTFRFGGLSPDAGQGPSDSVGEVKVDTTGDDTITASMEASGSSGTVEFIHETSPGDNTENLALQDDDGDKIVAVEGDPASEDEYVLTDAGDFSHIWQVSNVDVDTTDLTANGASGDEATVTLKDAVTGDSVELDMDADGDGNGATNDDVYEGTEVIDGQTYHATLATQDTSSTSDDDLVLTWGTDAGFGSTGGSASGATTAFPTVETETGARVGFYDPGQDPSGIAFGTDLIAFNSNEKFYDAASQSTEGANGFGDGDDIVRDVGGSGTYSTGADTSLNTGNDGSVDSSNGATLNALSGITGGTYYLISGDSNVNSSEDVVNDDDSDGVYTANQDTFYDTDGTTSNATGSSQDSAGTGLAGAETVSTSASTSPGGSGAIYFVDADGSLAGAYNSTDEIFLDPNIGTAGNLELDLNTTIDNDNDGTAGEDAVVYDGGDGAIDTAENTTMTQFQSGDGVDFADGGATSGSYDDGEDIVTDSGGSGTLSLSADTTVNANGDGVSASDGSAMVDLSTASGGQWVDIDGNGYDAGDEIFLDDDSDTVYTSQADTLVDDTDGTQDVSNAASLTAFASSTKHEDGDGNSQMTDGEVVVKDDGSGDYNSDDTILANGGNAGNVRYWSSDAEETNAVSGLSSILPSSEPAFVFIEEEADDDTQYSYTVTGNWDSGDSEVTVASPSFSDSSKRQTRQMESDDDVTAGYDVWGTHTLYDSSDQHSFTLHYPAGQASAGAAFTAMDGSLSSSGSAGSVTTQVPAGWPDVARLDSEVSSPSTSTILVGGPVVNSLVQTLADQGMTQSASEYSDGQAIVQYIEDAWSSGNHALVVAGQSGQDTREAANFLANYRSNQDRMAGKSKVTLTTAQSTQ